MPRTITFTALASSLTIAACSQVPKEEAEEYAHEPLVYAVASAKMANSDGNATGTAELSQFDGRLELSVKVWDMPEGPHGFHLHTAGDCSASDFTSAGGHLNPLGKGHGSLNPAGQHLGDMPNLDVEADGSGEASAILEGASEDLQGYLFDDDGTAIVIHAGPDDYKSDPAGAAGPRIACGVLKRP